MIRLADSMAPPLLRPDESGPLGSPFGALRLLRAGSKEEGCP